MKEWQDLRSVAVIIPSLNPDERLPSLVEAILSQGFGRILIVNDGSRPEFRPIFDRLRKIPACTVLEHPVNRGKGRALKTAFAHYLDICEGEQLVGVVTADADGQHLPEDIRRTAEALLHQPDALVLGTRNFGEENIPFKSRSGNKITTQVFRLLYGRTVHDTQTGLRGIPRKWLPVCLELPGERFEYEIHMLVEAVRQNVPIEEVLIQTVYFQNNRETHFHPVKDSVRIYRVMFSSFLRFSCASLFSALLDQGLFALFQKVLFAALPIGQAIWLATACARLISSYCNYTMNRVAVFRPARQSRGSLPRYYLLCAAQLLASALCVAGLHALLPLDPSLIKLPVDTLLFFLGYQIQQRWVFR